MPRGIPNPKPAAENAAPVEPFGGKGDHDGDGIVGGAHAPVEAFELYKGVPEPKMVAMELLKNYRPSGPFEIVGYNQPAVTRKNAAGMEVEVEPKKFIAGVEKPAAQPGTGIAGKIWAGTVIKLTEAEARTVKANGIAERGFDD